MHIYIGDIAHPARAEVEIVILAGTYQVGVEKSYGFLSATAK